jgi:hypothetical protein
VVAVLVAGTPTLSGSFTVAPGTATGGTGAITATQTWDRGAAATGPWVAIAGATGLTYTPVAADAGMFIRCTVTYTDSGTTAQTATASVVSAAALPGGRTTIGGISFGVPGPWVTTSTAAPFVFTGPGGATISQPFNIDPSTAAPTVEPNPAGALHGLGAAGDWTAVNDPTHTGRPPTGTSNWKWTNGVTGQVLWQTDNPGAPLPAGAVWDAANMQYSGPIPAPGGPFLALGFLWRSPDTWHWDATHLVWINDRTGEATSQQANKYAGLNPHTTPTAADTGPFSLGGVQYAAMSGSGFTWRQVSTGVWQRFFNGVANGAPVTQATDPTKMPP